MVREEAVNGINRKITKCIRSRLGECELLNVNEHYQRSAS